MVDRQRPPARSESAEEPIAYHLIARREPYRELGADYFDQQQPVATANRLLRRLRRLGYDVTVTAAPEPTASADAVAVVT